MSPLTSPTPAAAAAQRPLHSTSIIRLGRSTTRVWRWRRAWRRRARSSGLFRRRRGHRATRPPCRVPATRRARASTWQTQSGKSPLPRSRLATQSFKTILERTTWCCRAGRSRPHSRTATQLLTSTVVTTTGDLRFPQNSPATISVRLRLNSSSNIPALGRGLMNSIKPATAPRC